MAFDMILEIKHVDIGTQDYFAKTVRMKIELIIEKLLKVLERENQTQLISIGEINSRARRRIVLDRFHDTSSTLRRISSVGNELRPFPIRTTCTASLADNPLAKHFPA